MTNNKGCYTSGMGQIIPVTACHKDGFPLISRRFFLQGSSKQKQGNFHTSHACAKPHYLSKPVFAIKALLYSKLTNCGTSQRYKKQEWLLMLYYTAHDFEMYAALDFASSFFFFKLGNLILLQRNTMSMAFPVVQPISNSGGETTTQLASHASYLPLSQV